jgi:hypothetical protein
MKAFGSALVVLGVAAIAYHFFSGGFAFVHIGWLLLSLRDLGILATVAGLLLVVAAEKKN